tara:strand:- start:4296 stop:5030 length:735 start_codon:yes stop_codon:yes gene_type:complete
MTKKGLNLRILLFLLALWLAVPFSSVSGFVNYAIKHEPVINNTLEYTQFKGRPKPETNRKGKRKAASVRSFVMKQIKRSGLERENLLNLKKEMQQSQSRERSHFKYLRESLVSHEGRVNESGQGHTIAKHVGLSIKALRDRYLKENSSKNISTFKSLRQAEHLIERTIHEKMKTPEGRKKMKDLVDGKIHKLEWIHTFNESTGQSVYGPTGQVTQTNAVIVRLRRDPNRPNGWRVLTAFPTKSD